VQAAGISSLLLAIVFGVYLATRPPSAETLIAVLDRAESDATRLAAAEKYLQTYGETADERSEKAAKVFREAKVREREKQLAKRFANPSYRINPEGDDPKAYELGMTAIQAEKEGRLADALNLWSQVKGVFPDDAKTAYTFDEEKLKRARWGWIAEKRVREIEEARRKDVELDASIAANRNNEKAMPFDPSNARSLAVRARRLEQIGDPEKAARTWDTLLGFSDPEGDVPAWMLLAGEHRVKIKDAKTNKAELLARPRLFQSRLEALKKNSGATPLDWKNLRADSRDFVELYEDETEKAWQEAVSRAKSVLDAATSPP
jgi:eukaryotic-like serine/threonine-protein kinase